RRRAEVGQPERRRAVAAVGRAVELGELLVVRKVQNLPVGRVCAADCRARQNADRTERFALADDAGQRDELRQGDRGLIVVERVRHGSHGLPYARGHPLAATPNRKGAKAARGRPLILPTRRSANVCALAQQKTAAATSAPSAAK